jgi:hypothetical protein
MDDGFFSIEISVRDAPCKGLPIRETDSTVPATFFAETTL